MNRNQQAPGDTDSLETKNQQFIYSEILSITNNFQKIVGRGGYGTMYHGYVGDAQVAVKMLSPTSVQGYKEFQTEAKLLMSVHHKNLTALVGYCNEGTNIGIISSGQFYIYPSRKMMSLINDYSFYVSLHLSA